MISELHRCLVEGVASVFDVGQSLIYLDVRAYHRPSILKDSSILELKVAYICLVLVEELSIHLLALQLSRIL